MKKYLFLLIFALGNFLIAQNINQNNQKPLEFKAIEHRNENPLIFGLELPVDFPKIKIDTVNNPTPGNIFMEVFDAGASELNYIMILNEKGEVIYYKKPHNLGIDFKLQANGLFSYSSRVQNGDQYQAGPIKVQNILVQQMILDKDYNVIDSVQTQNEYLSDMHDFRILPNGNYLLIAYEHVNVDMSKIVPGGNPNAIVVGTVIQELDKDKKCVFQWRSLDHIPILATKDDLLKAVFEHVHGNSLFLDKDGNLITSFPTTFEIVKLNMVTGEIIWRFGGDANQFEITGDNPEDAPYYFRMQHDAKLLDNGNMLFYDNAVQKKSGWSSRAVEYEFDQVNKKANLVWEYKHNPPVSAFAMGSAQRLKSGNTLINWGLIFLGQSKGMTEVTADKQTTFEMTLPQLKFSYRAQKNDIPACQPVDSVSLFEMLEGNTYNFNDKNDSTNVKIYFDKLDAFMYNMLTVEKFDCSPQNMAFETEAPVILPFKYWLTPQLIYSSETEVSFDLSKISPYDNAEKLIVYSRPVADSGTFKKLPTRYDKNENRIVAECKEFGEFVVGFEREANKILAPKLMLPENNRNFANNSPMKISWSSTGRYDKFRLQIAKDDKFENIVLDSNDIQTPIIRNFVSENNQDYFWRTKTFYRDLESDWSETRKFSFGEPYITMVYPNGGEKLTKDSTYVFRWNTNISDSVSIYLMREDSVEAIVKENLKSHSNAFAFTIPKTIKADTRYKLVVSSTKSDAMLAESDNYFSIGDAVGVEESISIEDYLRIMPNPANLNSNIEFSVVDAGDVSISIYDNLGNEIQTILNKYLNNGRYEISLNTNNFNSGIYYIIKKEKNNSTVEKLIIHK